MKTPFHAASLGLLLAVIWQNMASAQAMDLTQGGAVDVTANNGLDYDQSAMTLSAHGNARAVRGNVTVLADTLIAHLRKKAAAPGPKPATATTPSKADKTAPDGSETGSDEIYRLEALGHVRIVTPTDHVEGADHGIYDMDQAVLVLTGPHMVLTTPQQVMTARDSMEYWSQRHMAVGRGNAVITTNDGRRIAGDTLVGYTKPDAPADPHQPKQKQPQTAQNPANPGGKLERVEAYGHVIIRTQTETITGDRGVYLPDTGIARLLGHVHITRSQNQLDGDEGVVNVHTGVSTLLHPGDAAGDDTGSNPGKGQVAGLLMPSDQASHNADGTAKSDKTKKSSKPNP